jgi:tRNA pseudouridine38-40 synthase
VRYRVTLAYDGSAYQGFQRQREGVPTVQAAVEQAIRRVTRSDVTIIAAGRTDTGVHATGQVIAFDVEWRHPDSDLLRALNAVLPYDIALVDLVTSTAEFHPRFDAQARRYRYSVLQVTQRRPLSRLYTWQIAAKLDASAMQAVAELLVGRHDFATFGNPPHEGSSTVRDVFVSLWDSSRDGDDTRLTYTVEATAFLHHMVRRMVGMMVDVGRGHLTVDEFKRIFAAADLSQATTMAPPQGLCLEKVRYPGDS